MSISNAPAASPEAREGTFANLFRHLRSGAAHCRMEFDGDAAVDWVYLNVNDAFVRQTGLHDVAGRKLSEVVPGLLQEDPEPFARYAQVVTTGEPAEFEQHVKALDAWFAVSVYRPAPGEFVAVFDPITERKRAEEALRASEARFRAVFEQAAVGIAKLDASGAFLRANPKLCAMLGYEEAELCTLRYPAITHPDHAESDRELHRQLLSDPAPALEFEKRLLRKDGTTLWANVTISRADIDEPFYIAVIEDISARKAAEAKLRASEERMRLFVEHAPSSIALFDREMRYLAASRRYVEDMRLGDQPLIGRCHYDVFPGIPEAWKDVHRRCLAGASESSDEDTFMHADGSVDWLRWAMHPWRDDRGEIGGLLLFGEIITQQHRAAQALSESEARYRALFEQASIGMAQVDRATGTFLAVNDAFCRIIRSPREELIRLTIGDVTHPDERAADRAMLAQMHAGSMGGFIREKRYLRGDGTVFWGRVTVSGLARSGDEPGMNMALLEDIDERRRATDALAESDQRLRAVFRGSLAGLAIVDLATRKVVDVSESFVALFGWSREELVGRTTDDVDFYVDKADRERVVRGFREPGVPLEFRVKRKSGEVGTFLVTLAQIEVNGAPCGISMWHDVTELRRADAALRASERHLRATFDLAPIGIAESDPKTGRWRQVNRRICEITGYSAEELRALSIPDDLTHPDDRESSRAWFVGVNAGLAEPSHFQRRYLRNDGSVAWVELDVALLRDDAGNTIGTLAAIEDVTERKRAEAELQASQARYRELVDNLEDVVFTVDALGALTFVNRAIASFGYEPSALHGVVVADLLHPDDRPLLAVLLRDGTGNLPRELRLYDADGKLRNVRASLRRASEAEQHTGMAGVLVDITRQRETEEQLRAAQKMEAVGRLAGGVAHDFNNLLSVILSYTELAVEALPAEDQLAMDLGEVMKAGLRAEGLTRQLLAFSRRQVLDPRRLR